MDNFAEFYQDGGVWMHFIALTAIIGAGVTIERFIFLFFRFNINGGQFFNQIQKLVMANNIDRAIKLCNAADKAALARVIKAGLTRANKGEADIAAAIRDGTLVGASLDVFESEPLPADSPLWDLPNVVITPHVAAVSDPVALARQIADQIDALERGEKLRNLVDRSRGY